MAKAISLLKLGKADGIDGTSSEMLRHIGETTPTFRELRLEKENGLGSLSIIAAEKGDNRECQNHQGMSFLSV